MDGWDGNACTLLTYLSRTYDASYPMGYHWSLVLRPLSSHPVKQIGMHHAHLDFQPDQKHLGPGRDHVSSTRRRYSRRQSTGPGMVEEGLACQSCRPVGPNTAWPTGARSCIRSRRKPATGRGARQASGTAGVNDVGNNNNNNSHTVCLPAYQPSYPVQRIALQIYRSR